MPVIKGLGQSAVLKNTQFNRKTALYGWTVDKNGALAGNSSLNIKYVDVDIDNKQYSIQQAALGSIVDTSEFSKTLSDYLSLYLNDISLSRSDVTDRLQRMASLDQMAGNDTYISRTVTTCADEATQIDAQTRLITIKSPNPAFVSRCYQLLTQWGITQGRIHSTIEKIQLYGEAFWGCTVTGAGVTRITPLNNYQIKERLEFDPIKMAELKSHLTGDWQAYASRSTQIQSLIDNQEEGISDAFAQVFEKRLFGYRLDDNLIIPPWQIVHFRYNADGSDYAPYGEPPMIRCLGPFRQAYLSKSLQGLARVNSFPTKVYSVKTVPGLGEAEAFREVQRVRQRYQNIGVTPQSNSMDAYTVNTEVWAPDGLLKFEVFDSKVDFNFVDDIQIYNDEVARGAIIPRAYLDQEFGGYGQSGIALIQQYKPFARHVYALQTAFIEELGALFRLHFAITNEFDYNVPFTISMNLPAAEIGQEQRDSQNATLDQTQSIFDLLKTTLGLSDDDIIPEDIAKDIMAHYTFLNPTDIERWFRIANAQIEKGNSDDEEGGDEDGGFDDMGGGDEGGGGDDFDLGASGLDGGDSGGSDESADSDTGATNESRNRAYYRRIKKSILEEKRRNNRYYRHVKKSLLDEAQKKKLEEVRKIYKASSEQIYFEFLNENHIKEWADGQSHAINVPQIDESSNLFYEIKALRGGVSNTQTLNENEEEELPTEYDYGKL